MFFCVKESWKKLGIILFFFPEDRVRSNEPGVHQKWLWEVLKKTAAFKTDWVGYLGRYGLSITEDILEQVGWICVLGGLVIADSALDVQTQLDDLSSSDLWLRNNTDLLCNTLSYLLLKCYMLSSDPEERQIKM